MKVYAIFPDSLNNSMAVHDMPVDALTKVGVICQKQADFFAFTPQLEEKDLVIMWVGSKDEERLNAFSSLKCRKVIKNIDSCSSDRVLFKRELQLYDRLGLEGLLITYCTEYNHNFLAEKGMRSMSYPHLLDFDKFTVQNPVKKYDVFISGHLSETSYPLRHKLANFFIKRQNKYRICYLPHPGYRLTNLTHGIYGQDYINLASESHLSIVCTGDDDSLVVKYLEFAAGKTLPIGDAPSNMPDFAKSQMILVSKNMSDDEIEKIVDNSLINQDDLTVKTLNYYSNMKENFDISKTKHFIDKLIRREYNNM